MDHTRARVKCACHLAQSPHRLGKPITLTEVLFLYDAQHPEHFESCWFATHAHRPLSADQSADPGTIIYKVSSKVATGPESQNRVALSCHDAAHKSSVDQSPPEGSERMFGFDRVSESKILSDICHLFGQRYPIMTRSAIVFPKISRSSTLNHPEPGIFTHKIEAQMLPVPQK
ncbi:MAG: hypothetical protein JKY96_00320 [Phycisphaerales bacterium]|nr:hypothetical protein [Phycisphaerales bacterium]